VTRIETLLAGPARPVDPDGPPLAMTGIAKTPLQGAHWLTRTGLAGDEQGDRLYHGGVEKALHHYPAEHYPMWQPWGIGGVGENISTSGLTEPDVHIGDLYRAGETLLQVSQGRQPCWKLNLRMRRPDAALQMQRSGRTGWYYRVLREGWLESGMALELVDRPHPGWPLARVIAALFAEGPVNAALAGEWRQLALLDALPEGWRNLFARRVATGVVEDWSKRLTTPAA